MMIDWMKEGLESEQDLFIARLTLQYVRLRLCYGVNIDGRVQISRARPS